MKEVNTVKSKSMLVVTEHNESLSSVAVLHRVGGGLVIKLCPTLVISWTVAYQASLYRERHLETTNSKVFVSFRPYIHPPLFIL